MFHGTGNSAQLWQNFGISGGGRRGVEPPRYANVSNSAQFIIIIIIIIINITITIIIVAVTRLRAKYKQK
jgi:hypothetical protein